MDDPIGHAASAMVLAVATAIWNAECAILNDNPRGDPFSSLARDQQDLKFAAATAAITVVMGWPEGPAIPPAPPPPPRPADVSGG